jgi:hypothetical protein
MVNSRTGVVSVLNKCGLISLLVDNEVLFNIDFSYDLVLRKDRSACRHRPQSLMKVTFNEDCIKDT